MPEIVKTEVPDLRPFEQVLEAAFQPFEEMRVTKLPDYGNIGSQRMMMRMILIFSTLKGAMPTFCKCIRLFFCLLIVSFITPGVRSQQVTPESALAAGDFAKAEAIYRSELLRNPGSAQLLTDLGVALQMQGKSADAIAAFRRALKIEYLPATYALLAEERCKSRDVEGAKPMLERILRENATNPRILAIAAPCYREADLPLDSIDIYQILLGYSAFPKDLALVELSRSYVAAAAFFVGRLKAATGGEAYFQALTAAHGDSAGDPRSAFALAARSSAFFHSHDSFPQALATWRLHQDDPALVYQMSVLSSEAVLQTFGRCSEQFPDSPYLAEFRAEVLADQGNQQAAIATLEALAVSHPDLPDLPYILGMLYRRQRDWANAAAAFRKQVDSDPKDERAAARLSEALLNLASYNDLQAFLTPRIRPNNTAIWARLDLATAEQALGHPEVAISLLAAGERDDPTNPTIHYRLMILYRDIGDRSAMARELADYKLTKH